MIIIEEKEVFEKLTMEICIGLMKQALTDLAKGKCIQPMRSIHKLPQENTFGFMPAYLGEHDYFGAKVINACGGNHGTKYPSHMGYVMMFDADHGMPLALVDANAITQIRTGAVSGAATDLLARKNASKLAIIGTGAQGRSHLEAMLCVRSIKEVKVYDLSGESAQKFKEEMEEKFKVPIRICDTAQEAVSDADIVCTVTPSKEAYLKVEWIKRGAHINAVGTFTSVTREVTSELVAASKLYADSVEAMKKESGEYLIPLKEGLINENHIKGSIGDVLVGSVKGRENEQEITLFDALGLAVEDVMCGRYFCELNKKVR